MKGAIALAVVTVSSATLLGQDAAPPNVNLEREETVVATPTPLPSPDIPELSQLDAIFKQTSLGKQADERRLHIEWRQLANQASNDPDVIAAKSVIKTARTDFEKRQRMRDYYNLYYGRMRAKASSAEMKSALDTVKATHIGLTQQPHVRPSTDSPSPTATPAADGAILLPMKTPNPSASPQRKHKKKSHFYRDLEQ